MASERIQQRIEVLLKEADQWLSQSKWAAVQDRVQNVLALDPDNNEAALFLAAARRALGHAGDTPSLLIQEPEGSQHADTVTGEPPTTEFGYGDNFQAVKAVLDVVIKKLKDLESQGALKSITVYDLDESHPLKQPIHAVLQESGDAVLASWPELHLYTEGETPNDAIAALKVEIIGLYDDLSSTSPSKLGVLPQRWLRTLTQVIRRDA